MHVSGGRTHVSSATISCEAWNTHQPSKTLPLCRQRPFGEATNVEGTLEGLWCAREKGGKGRATQALPCGTSQVTAIVE